MGEAGTPVKLWFFRNGIPLKWTGPSLSATQNEAAIETLEIAHEGLELFSPHVAVSGLLQTP
jgi:phage tail-like protein